MPKSTLQDKNSYLLTSGPPSLLVGACAVWLRLPCHDRLQPDLHGLLLSLDTQCKRQNNSPKDVHATMYLTQLRD